jgi:quinol monooxygenase YgiN
MLIIAGHLYVALEDRDKFVASHQDLLVRARKAEGCLDLAISADPVEAGRANMCEIWESQEALDAWRAVAHGPAPVTEFLGGNIKKYIVSGTGPVF